MTGVEMNIDKKFIYVFSIDDKNKLLSLGYKLVKPNEDQKIYVFENTGEFKFSAYDTSFVLSDTLTF